MSFAHPLALLLLLLLIPIALLYWLRQRVPRVAVGTGRFWQQALAEEGFRSGWQRWRTPVSLFLHMLIVVLLAVSVAGPAIPPPQRIVLVLDNSATMRATDVQPSRIEAAKDVARRIIERLRWCDEMAIVTTNPNPMEIQTLTSNQTLLCKAIDSVQALAEPLAIGQAIMVAQEIAPHDQSQRKTVIITDGCAQDQSSIATAAGAEVLHVGTAAGNRAITCFAARRSKTDPTLFEVFVELQNYGNQTTQGKLELNIDGEPGPSVPFAIEKDGHWIKTFDGLAASRGGHLTARIAPADSYPFDDFAEIRLDRQYDSDVYYPYLQQIEGGVAKLYRSILLARLHPKQRSVLSMPPYQELLGPLYGEPNGIDIRVSSEAEAAEPTLGRESPRPPIWLVLSAAAALVVVAEWCLCQRCWTC